MFYQASIFLMSKSQLLLKKVKHLFCLCALLSPGASQPAEQSTDEVSAARPPVLAGVDTSALASSLGTLPLSLPSLQERIAPALIPVGFYSISFASLEVQTRRLPLGVAVPTPSKPPGLSVLSQIVFHNFGFRQQRSALPC